MHSELSSVVRELRADFFPASLHPGPDPPWPQEERFNQLAVRLFHLQHRLNPSYRRICEARGRTPDGVRHWRDIPAVSTAAFKEFTLSCLPAATRTVEFVSSGTTQTTPSRQRHSRESLELYHDSLLPWFQAHLVPDTAREDAPPGTWGFLSLTPPLGRAPHSSLVHMLDTVARQPWFSVSTFAGELDAERAWHVSRQTVSDAVRDCAAAGRPIVLCGTAFNFVHLLDAPAPRPLRLPPGSRLMETGGYKGRSRSISRTDLHRMLADEFGVRPEDIVTEYGMTELGSQAYDRVAGSPGWARSLRFPPWTRATVVSPETGLEVAEGDTGLVRVVDLANAFTVAAIETEDLAVRRADGFELLGRRRQAEPRGCSLMAG